MRTLWILGLGLAACSVPDQKVGPGDGGIDGATPQDAPSDAPDTMITSAPPEFSRAGAATFEFSSNLATAQFECSIDSEVPAACTSPYTRQLADGSHTFSVRARDAGGQSDDTPAEHVWSIDTVAPDTMFTETPPSADNSTTVRFSFDSGERNADFDCSLDGAAYAACTSGATVGPIADGAHSFAVRAHDRAGNIDASPAIFAWTVDTSTPDTQLVAGPSGPQAATTAQFTFFSPDAGAGATFECKLDTGAFAACVSPRDLTGLGEGSHTFSVRVRDAVGNLDPSPATRTWLVDLTPPETTILTGPSGVVAQASATFTFTSNEMGVTYACSFDGATFASCDSPESATALAQGAHTFAVRATDAAGHTDATAASRSWTVDTIAPGITVTSGPVQNGASGPRVVIGFMVTEGTVTCSLDSAPFAPCASPFAANLPAGSHTVRIRAADAAGNVTTVTRAFTVACAAPDAAGAAGLLHLDDTGQVLVNAVTGGADATLGSDATVEVADPASTTGRFGGALVFAAAESDHVAWPVALPAGPDVTVELWARPDAIGGTRDLVTSTGLAVRVQTETASTVRISVTVGSKSAVSAPVAAGTWHHVVASQTAGTLRLWVDGVRTEVAGATDPFALDAITLGGSAAGAFSGAIDEVWVGQAGTAMDESALVRYCPL